MPRPPSVEKVNVLRSKTSIKETTYKSIMLFKGMKHEEAMEVDTGCGNNLSISTVRKKEQTRRRTVINININIRE